MFKNVVIISIDSLRADGINYNRDLIYGKGNHEPLKTPNLDEFAKKGTTFLNAYSTNTYTTSAHASLFTGQYPPVHGIRAFFDFKQKLNPKYKTIAEELNEKGFQTFFYSDVPDLFSYMDIWRGFKIKTYEQTDWLWNSIEEFKKDRNFVFIHLFDIHEPYLFIEDKSEDKKINEEYYDVVSDLRKKIKIKSKINQQKKPHDSWGEIRNYLNKNLLDHQKYLSSYYFKGVERFDKFRYPKIIERLNSLGFKNDNTLYLLLSDHGEGRTHFFNNLNLFSHGFECTEEVLRIFFLINIRIKKYSNQLSIKDVKNIIFSLLNNQVIFFKNKDIYSEYIEWNKTLPRKLKKYTFRKLKNIDHWIKQRIILKDGIKFVIYNKPEFIINFYKNLPLLEKLPIKKILFEFYVNIFGRLPDKEEYKYWLKQYSKNNLTIENLYKYFINSEEFIKQKNFLKSKPNKLADDVYYAKNYLKKEVFKKEIIKTLLNINKIIETSN